MSAITELLSRARAAGVTVFLEDSSLRAHGTQDALEVWAAPLKARKAELLAHLSPEVCGPYSPYCCPISPELVQELHRLITEYAVRYCLSAEATSRIIEAAKRQSAASVPESVAYFKGQLGLRAQS